MATSVSPKVGSDRRFHHRPNRNSAGCSNRWDFSAVAKGDKKNSNTDPVEKSRWHLTVNEANGPGANDRNHVCHYTLPWLISFS